MITLYLTPIDSIEEKLNAYAYDTEITMYLANGVYHQKLNLYHHRLKLIGTSSTETIITYSDYSYKMHEDGLLYNTFRTSTVTVYGNDCVLSNLTIRNDAGSGFTTGQAIALSLYGNQTHVSRCILSGHQDTLFIGPLPEDLVSRYSDFLPSHALHHRPLIHFFDFCEISGDVDFIFGSGTALFNNCKIIALNKGYIAAPSTSNQTLYGFIFKHCLIQSQSSLEDVYLARPWREFGSTVYLDCHFEGFFHPNRYDTWDKTNFRFIEMPYLDSQFSIGLSKEEVEQLNCFIQTQISLLQK